MPSTYSTNLKIELMATGENASTWGDITNTNLGTALEQAVVGYGNPNYSSDANLTISITDSNAAQAARALVLNVTSSFGSLSTTRELIVPTIQKQYVVQNNTTGGQSITVKTASGTGVTVPNGRKAHLYVDGTNVIQMFDFVDINGGTIDGTPVGGSSASTGAFTTLSASSTVNFAGLTASTLLTADASKNVVSTTTGTGVVTALGNNVNSAGGFTTIDGVATLTNKRINTRVSSTASTASITPDIASFDQYCVTAQAAPLAINAPTGTPVDGNRLIFRLLDNGSPRAITWDGTYTVIGVTLPTTTTASKMTYVGCIYNAANTRWDVIAVTTQA